jgi:hypothetical protein
MPTTPKDPSSDVRIWFRPFGFGIMYLLFGGFVFCHALFDQWTYSEILEHGEIATAEVFNMKYNNPYYVAELDRHKQGIEQSRAHGGNLRRFRALAYVIV